MLNERASGALNIQPLWAEEVSVLYVSGLYPIKLNGVDSMLWRLYEHKIFLTGHLNSYFSAQESSQPSVQTLLILEKKYWWLTPQSQDKRRTLKSSVNFKSLFSALECFVSWVNIHKSSVWFACPAGAAVLLFSQTLNDLKPANGCSLPWPQYLCMGDAGKASMLPVR